jgi:hypothetical protein
MRTMYSSFQSGTLRGRRDAAITGGTPPNGLPVVDHTASADGGEARTVKASNGKANKAAPEDVTPPEKGMQGSDADAPGPETKKRGRGND